MFYYIDSESEHLNITKKKTIFITTMTRNNFQIQLDLKVVSVGIPTAKTF